MVVALYLIALAMIGAGAACVAYGYGIILNERGWTMVISGSVVASAGLVLVGLAVTAGRVKRLQQEFAALRDNLGRAGAGVPTRPVPPPAAEAAAPAVRPPPPRAAGRDEPEEHAVLKAADAIPEPAPAAPGSALAAPGGDAASVAESGAEPSRTVIGTYSSGGNAYVMYADGAIEADTPTGRYTFQSLEELKEFIAAGGEQPARSG
jgi:hypothetical protein